MSPTERQEEREAAQRQAAMGRRVAAIQAGNLGPVLKRWINADVAPIATLLRAAARAYLDGDMAEVALLLDTPAADLDEGKRRERPLRPLLEWCLRGKSPGRVNDEATYADDIVLSFMAVAISVIAQSHTTRKNTKGPSFASVMAASSDAVRQTVLGQFISGIQGASAMQAIRERKPEIWKQKKSLSRICSLLQSQAKPMLRDMAEAGVESVLAGHRTVLHVVNAKGDDRMLTVTPPDATAWEVMSLCWQSELDGGTSEYRSLWLGFTAMILAAAQRTGGWFEVAGSRTGRKGHTRTTKYLILSDAAHEAVKRDTERWLGQGFDPEPMIVPPEAGDYLTVKHKPVTGQRPPRGLLTRAKGTTSWDLGAIALANTPWTVNVAALDAATQVAWEDANSMMRVGAHRRLAAEEAFYLPTCMDFRGRVYYRTPWVSPQSGDLGKSMLCFPVDGKPQWGVGTEQALAMHFAGLYGGPNKVDKAPLSVRQDWFEGWLENPTFVEADKPLTLRAHWELYSRDWYQTNRIPIQLDGTCNGLQHLSAMFRDHEAAPHVNLTRSSLEEAPADIYQVVADIVDRKMAFENTYMGAPQWMLRMWDSGVKIGRKLTKGPVMVLPYGGTREAVRLSVKAAVLDQLGDRALGTANGGASDTPWHRMSEDGYHAFEGRDLFDHPGFNSDVGALAALVWDSISPAIPRAMQAMSALTGIGAFVGERGLSWRVGGGPEEQRLWVVQAKSKSARRQVKMRGFHLPDMVRRLTLMANVNEVDPKGHRTGIVANVIHSLDAAHLAAAVALFRSTGGGCVGSVHDCVMVRPSEAALMGRCLRESFVEMYEADPLAQPVRLIPTVDGEELVEYPSWYALAEAAGVVFPERGSFDIREVRDSAWFFS